jgi:RNA polymerase sigma factor (sigma-70 family)
MQDPSFGTLYLHERVARWREGDPSAADELLRAAQSRLERLARRMLRGFPGVRNCADTGDVLQNACMRLLAALRSVVPGSTREFFGLSALQIRRELLDLAQSQAGRKTVGLDEAGGVAAPADEDLELWQDFHEAVARLPAEEREVVGLVHYHGWTQVQAAELLGVSERTVRRYWVSASARLAEALGGRFPEVEG